MGRKKKSEILELRADLIFGDEQNLGVMCKISTIESAHHCKECGRLPRLHDFKFLDNEKAKEHYYMDCECGCCDGKWYPTPKAAANAWDAENPSTAKPVMPYGFMDSHDFYAKTFKKDEKEK